MRNGLRHARNVRAVSVGIEYYGYSQMSIGRDEVFPAPQAGTNGCAET
jgi:hypothetical protein